MCATPFVGEMAYFRAGLVIADTVRQISSQWCGSIIEPQYLDFACGYGRSLRFTAQDLGAGAVTGAEILPGAVTFVRESLGVTALPSSTRPEEFSPSSTFDLIFVSSLFSHLPDHLFYGWLDRLRSCLSDRGLLAFSTHDAPLLPPDATLDERGYYFQPTTEVTSLDTADYGATIVTEDFVQAAINSVFGHGEYARVPRGLCFEQDLYLVPRDPSGSTESLHIRRGPQGAIDDVSVEVEQPTVSVTGWAATQDHDDAVVAVELRLDGALLARVAPWAARPDVARAIGADGKADCLASGWRVKLPVDRGQLRPDATLVATALTRQGLRGTFYSIPLDEVVAGSYLATPKVEPTAEPDRPQEVARRGIGSEAVR